MTLALIILSSVIFSFVGYALCDSLNAAEESRRLKVVWEPDQMSVESDQMFFGSELWEQGFRLLKLDDGTRCIALVSNERAAIDCDWRDRENSRRPLVH